MQHYTDIASEKLYTANEFLQEEATAEDVRKITNSEFRITPRNPLQLIDEM